MFLTDLSGSIFKLKYVDIRSIPIHAIFDHFLNFKDRDLDAADYGLRIHDMIIKLTETLSSFESLEVLFDASNGSMTYIYAFVIK